MRAYYRGLRIRPNFLQRRLFQASQVREKAVRAELVARLRGKPKWPERAPAEISSWLESLGLGPVFTLVS